MALPTNNKNNKQGKGAKTNPQGGSKFIQKPGGAVKPSGGVAKKANRTGGTRGS